VKLTSPTLVAIDTAADVCSVAVVRDNRILVRAEAVGHRHSERVLPMLEALLDEHAIRLVDCDAIAFGAGPGAFTGLRIACGIAQGLAYGVGRPIIAIGNLEALALAAAQQRPAARRILAAIDARMNEDYVAVYQGTHEGLTELAAPTLAAIDELPLLIEQWQPDAVAAQGLSKPMPSIELLALRAEAGAIATLALERWRRGDTTDAAHATPLYVRNHVAMTIAQRRTRAESVVL